MFDVKRGIANSMHEMMKTQSFTEITVSALIKCAGISRSTFYRYFEDKYDVMTYFYRVEVDEMLEEMEDWTSGLIGIFNFIQYRRDFFNQVLNMTGPYAFVTFLYDYSFAFYSKRFLMHYQKESLSIMDKYVIDYVCAGSVELVKKWAKSDYKESAETMANLTYSLLPQSIRTIFED